MRKFTLFLALSVFVFVPLQSQISKEQIKWILPKYSLSPADMAGDTLIMIDGSFVFVYKIDSDTILYWYLIPKLWKNFGIKYSNYDSRLHLTYLTTDTLLVHEFHSIDSGIVSKISLTFEYNKYPNIVYFDFKNGILYNNTKDNNLLILNYSIGDTLFNFSTDAAEFEDLVYSFSVYPENRYCAILGGKNIYLLNLKTMKIEKSYSFYSYPSHKIKISPDDKYIIRFGYDNTCDVVDIENDTINRNKVVGKTSQIEFISNSKNFLLREGSWILKYKLPEPSVEERETIANTLGSYFIVTNYQGQESLVIKPSGSKYFGSLYLNFIDTLGPRKRLYISPTLYFYPVGKEHLNFFLGSNANIYSALFNVKDGKFSGFFEAPISFSRIGYSVEFPYYYFVSNDTIYVADIFTHQKVKNIVLEKPKYNQIQFSNDFKYLLYRSYAEGDTCFKILDVEKNKVLYEFASDSGCIEPNENFSLSGYMLIQLGKFSKDARYFGFTYRKEEYSSPIFSVLDLEKGQILYNELIQSPFSFDFGDYGTDELFINNGSLQIRKINLKTNETFTFPEIFPIGSTRTRLINQPQTDYLVQIIERLPSSYICFLNKTNGKIEKYYQLIIDSLVINEAMLYFYFNEYYHLFFWSSSYPFFALWDTLATVASIEPQPNPDLTDNSFTVIYPNPVVEDFLTIYFPEEDSTEEISIIDVFGRLCKIVKAELGIPIVKVDVSSLPAGFYFLKYKGEIQKFVKY